ALNQPLRLPIPVPAKTLVEAVPLLGGALKPADHGARTIVIGERIDVCDSWSVWPHWDGWIAGVTPGTSRLRLGRADRALAGIASGALAVGEAFLAEHGNSRAGRTTQLLSLWAPEMSGSSLDPGPEDFALPLQLWLIGLGNLGQAYLWSLFSLPYSDPHAMELYLQDYDTIRSENWATSVLVARGGYGVLKTRIAEEWADRRGFRARRID